MIRRAEPGDIDDILPRIRPQERDTVARLGLDARALLREAIQGHAYSGLADASVACMWGISFPMPIGCYPRLWLLTTPLVEEHKIEFLRESRRFVAWAKAEFGPIEGCVDRTNVISARWLKWLGFHEVWSNNGFSWLRTSHGD